MTSQRDSDPRLSPSNESSSETGVRGGPTVQGGNAQTQDSPRESSTDLTGTPSAAVWAGTLLSSIDECEVFQLTLPRARWLAEFIASGALAPWVTLDRCRRVMDREVVEFRIRVELPQRRAYDIFDEEPIVVVIQADASVMPEVLAVRSDFPADVPHRNLSEDVRPVSLCLYDVRFRDIAASWTPSRFIARIQEWLQLTARGELHGADQPLEPLFLGMPEMVIVPHALIEQALQAKPVDLTQTLCIDLRVTGVRIDPPNEPFRVRLYQGAEPMFGSTSRSHVAIVIRLRARTHGAIRSTPRSLEEVIQALESEGDTPVQALRARVSTMCREQSASGEAHVILVLVVPVRREDGQPVTNVQTLTILTTLTFEEIGRRLGVLERFGGVLVPLLTPSEVQPLNNVPIFLAQTYRTLTREDLAQQQGLSEALEHRVVCIGAGALGSQVIRNAARSAAGRWTIVDDDALLPHNISRHVELDGDLGVHKALLAAAGANCTADSEPVHDAIIADILTPGPKAETVANALAGADLLVDMSASVTVARALARDTAPSVRCVSFFLSPTGQYLTMLAEDRERTVSLDLLEMQLYRAAIESEPLHALYTERGGRIRYGQSCRDISATVPQSVIAVHAGIATMQLTHLLQEGSGGGARLQVWRLDEQTGEVSCTPIPAYAAQIQRVGAWLIVTDEGLLTRLYEEREAKLPCETGGILLGHYDFVRRIVYIVATLPPPADSRGGPDRFTRGYRGLTRAVAAVQARTAGQFTYIGEWHSHPRGCSCLPSTPDENLFSWIRTTLLADCLPPLMLIVGDEGAVPYLETLPADSAYPAVFPVPTGFSS